MFRIIKTFLTSVILIAIGVALSFYGNKIINEFIDKNDPFVEVTATVIDYEYTGPEDEGAYTIYEYNVDGVVYKVSSNIKSTDLPTIGDTTTIKYNPSNPTEVVFLNGTNHVVMFVGVGFIIIGVFDFFRFISLLFRYPKRNKGVEVSE